MSRVLSDAEITALRQEKKTLPHRWSTRLTPKPTAEQVQWRRKLEIKGDNGHEFCVDTRVNALDQLDFSVILSFVDQDGQRYIITRYNGKHASHHTNKWEKRHGKDNASFEPAFHIHTATERYQLEGFKIDGYAEVTSQYASFDSALRSFVSENGFTIEGEESRPLFREP